MQENPLSCFCGKFFVGYAKVAEVFARVRLQFLGTLIAAAFRLGQYHHIPDFISPKVATGLVVVWSHDQIFRFESCEGAFNVTTGTGSHGQGGRESVNQSNGV
jgi:hypothetical protein